MSRVVGSGALSADIQLDLMRVIQARKEMTVEALARKHNVSKGTIKGVLYRLRRKARVELVPASNTADLGETHVAEESGQQAV
jgi:DNA-binding IclR family transcriptional regulator